MDGGGAAVGGRVRLVGFPKPYRWMQELVGEEGEVVAAHEHRFGRSVRVLTRYGAFWLSEKFVEPLPAEVGADG